MGVLGDDTHILVVMSARALIEHNRAASAVVIAGVTYIGHFTKTGEFA